MQMQLATVTQKGQVTIPISLRNFLGVKKYSKVAIIKGVDHIKIKPIGPSILDLAGKYRIPRSMSGILEAREQMEKNYKRF